MHLAAVRYTAMKPGICTDLYLLQALVFHFIVGEQRIKKQISLHTMDELSSPAAYKQIKE